MLLERDNILAAAGRRGQLRFVAPGRPGERNRPKLAGGADTAPVVSDFLIPGGPRQAAARSGATRARASSSRPMTCRLYASTP